MADLLNQLDKTPPFLLYFCYIMRNSRIRWDKSPWPLIERMTFDDIVAASKANGNPVSARTVTRLSGAITWANHQLSVIDAFASACGTSFLKVARGKRPRKAPGAKRTGEWVSFVTPYPRMIWLLSRGEGNRYLNRLDPRQRKRFDLCATRWIAVRENGRG